MLVPESILESRTRAENRSQSVRRVASRRNPGIHAFYSSTKSLPPSACTPENDLPRLADGLSGLRYYSPELGRWLSRDPIGEREEINFFVFVGNGPLGRLDLVGAVVVLPGQPEPGICGAFTWTVRLQPEAHETDGWIIQHVRRTLTITRSYWVGRCCKLTEPHTSGVELWEAWKVRRGVVLRRVDLPVGDITAVWGRSDDGLGTDLFARENEYKEAEGTENIEGEFMFTPSFPDRDTPPQFRLPPIESPGSTGGLPVYGPFGQDTKPDPPVVWTTGLKRGYKLVPHRIRTTWNCICRRIEHTRFVEQVPGGSDKP